MTSMCPKKNNIVYEMVILLASWNTKLILATWLLKYLATQLATYSLIPLPYTWNTLPLSLKVKSSLPSFRKALKDYLLERQ